MRTLCAAAVVATTLFLSCDAIALSFDERWKSLFTDSEVASDAVSAKAEMSRTAPTAERPARASRREARRHRSYHRRSYASRRGERHREWYKGGKRWHYVYTRRRRG